jgi:hypothetical protein
MNLNALIIEALKKTGVPYAWMYYTGEQKPYIQFAVYDEYGDTFADDIETATTYLVQIDVFSEQSPRLIAEQVKEYMVQAGFVRENTHDFFESDTLLYHKVLKFSFYYEI